MQEWPTSTQTEVKEVLRYAIYRSPLQVQLFNVVAMGSKNKGLFVKQSDVSFSEAQELTNQLNKELGLTDED